MTKKTNPESKRGPKPETLKIEGDWSDAVKVALDKKRPVGGWPDHKSPDDAKTGKNDSHTESKNADKNSK